MSRDLQSFSGSCTADGNLLFVPHTGDRVSLLQWPGLEEVAGVNNSDVFLDREGDRDSFDLFGAIVGRGRLLLQTLFVRLVLVDPESMKPVAEVRIPGYGWDPDDVMPGPFSDPDLFLIRGIGNGRFLADHNQRIDDAIWSIPEGV